MSYVRHILVVLHDRFPIDGSVLFIPWVFPVFFIKMAP